MSFSMAGVGAAVRRLLAAACHPGSCRHLKIDKFDHQLSCRTTVGANHCTNYGKSKLRKNQEHKVKLTQCGGGLQKNFLLI